MFIFAYFKINSALKPLTKFHLWISNFFPFELMMPADTNFVQISKYTRTFDRTINLLLFFATLSIFFKKNKHRSAYELFQFIGMKIAHVDECVYDVWFILVLTFTPSFLLECIFWVCIFAIPFTFTTTFLSLFCSGEN